MLTMSPHLMKKFKKCHKKAIINSTCTLSMLCSAITANVNIALSNQASSLLFHVFSGSKEKRHATLAVPCYATLICDLQKWKSWLLDSKREKNSQTHQSKLVHVATSTKTNLGAYKIAQQLRKNYSWQIHDYLWKLYPSQSTLLKMSHADQTTVFERIEEGLLITNATSIERTPNIRLSFYSPKRDPGNPSENCY